MCGARHHGRAIDRQGQNDHEVRAKQVEDEREDQQCLPPRDATELAVLVDKVRQREGGRDEGEEQQRRLNIRNVNHATTV